MSDITLILLCAGNSSRFENKVKKQWLRIGKKPLWLKVTNKLSSYAKFDKTIITAHKDEINYMKKFDDNLVYVTGGSTRQESIKNALQEVTTKYVMITDIARACVPKKIIKNLIKNKNKADCIVPYIDVSDTVVYQDQTIQRDDVKLIQTPQLSKTQILKKAIKTDIDFTDDSTAIYNYGASRYFIKGDIKSQKLTYIDDLNKLKCLKPASKDIFIGIGYDIHPFEANKKMFLGGVHIKSDIGFKAHSDGDVLIHSLIDAILGAAQAGDIGEFFPDTDDKYKNIDSKVLLENIKEFIVKVGYQIINIDITIIAQYPKVNSYKKEIQILLAKLLDINPYQINIKATTAEKLGFIGRKEGVAVQTVASLKFYNHKKGQK